MVDRGHFRSYGRRPVRLVASARQAGGEQAATVVDLSLAGACIELERPLPAHSRVLLSIVTPTFWDPLVIEGTVVWIAHVERTLRAGIRFVHAGEQALGALFELLGAQDYDADL